MAPASIWVSTFHFRYHFCVSDTLRYTLFWKFEKSNVAVALRHFNQRWKLNLIFCGGVYSVIYKTISTHSQKGWPRKCNILTRTDAKAVGRFWSTDLNDKIKYTQKCNATRYTVVLGSEDKNKVGPYPNLLHSALERNFFFFFFFFLLNMDALYLELKLNKKQWRKRKE